MHDSYDGGDDVVVNDSGESTTESAQEAATTENTEVTALDDAHESGGRSGEGGRHGQGEAGGAGNGEVTGSSKDGGETGGRAGRSAETQSTGKDKGEGSTSGRIDTGRRGKSAEKGKDGESDEIQPLKKADGEGSTSGRIDTGRRGKSAEKGKDGESDETQPLKKADKSGENGDPARDEKNNAERKGKAASAENKDNAETQENAEKSEQDRPGRYPPQSKVTIEGKSYRTDDNGNIHMFYDKDTKEWNMVANNEYTSRGYKYRTDDNGDIVHAEGKVDRSGERKSLNDKVPGLQEGDDRGHIIADRNDASNRRDNLFPQLSEKNRGEYKSMENHVAEAAADPNNDVRMSVDLVYPKDGETEHRPDWVYVTVTINGREENYQFDNRRDA